jgi:hypothetical protein
MVVRHYVDAAQRYLGAFEDTAPPVNGRPVEIYLPPLVVERLLPPYFIPEFEQILVPLYKQMVTMGSIDIEGELLIDGQYFVEA